jgi:predicted metal-dependent phosphoesterase TrpH
MLKRYYIYIILQLFAFYAFPQNAVESIPYGTNSGDPGFTYGLNSRDIISGLPYHFIQNDSLTLNFSPNAVQNNEIGSRQLGSIMDLVLKNTNRDNIDWTMFLFSNTPIVDFSDNSKVMGIDSVRLFTSDSSYNIFGFAKYNTQLKINIKYKLLPNCPIVKIKVNLINKSLSTIVGNWGYFVDPEEPTQENTFIPGKGTNLGIVNSGWTSNFIYSGINGNLKSNFQNHALAWVKNTPNKLIGYSYSFGIDYDINLKSTDSIYTEFYQITAVANKYYPNGAISCVTNWIDKLYDFDPDLALNYQVVAGKVEGTDNTNIKDAYVRLYKDINTLVAEVKTNELGEYKLIVPKLSLNTIYVVSSEKIGYFKQTRKFQIKSRKPINIDFLNKDKQALKVAMVDASFTKIIKSTGLVSSTSGDLILENNYFVMALSSKSTMPNSFIKKGTVLDFYIKGQELDLVDWLKISKISSKFDTLDAWWKNDETWIDTIYIAEKSSNRVIVKSEGKLVRGFQSGIPKSYETIVEFEDTALIINNKIKIINEYILEADLDYITVNTTISNTSTDTNTIYFGDIVKLGGGNERSYVPGIGEISSDFGSSSEFLKTPIQPWFANYSKYNVSYGIIYNENPDYVYAVKRWGSSVYKYILQPNKSIQVNRNVSIAVNNTNNLFRQKAIYNIYKSLAKNKSNFIANVSFSRKQLFKNDTLKVTVKYYNFTSKDISLYSKIEHPNIFKSISTQKTTVLIPKNDSVIINLYYVAISGGKANYIFNYQEANKYLFQESYQIFVNGPGWFRGDNHTHSTFSDGGSTIETNVIYARDFGLSFLTATDHNTMNHVPEINRLSLIYKDIILMSGEEVTTSRGHCLAYNINTLVPWNLSNYNEQNIIDSVKRQSNSFGGAFSYIAHPNDPIYNWKNLNILNLRGLEVWNSYNLDFNFKDVESRKSFAQWDSLNNIGRKLFGIANSDAHSAINVGANFIVAKLDTFSKQEVINVLRDKGTFYGSNGPELSFKIKEVEMGGTLYINSEVENVYCKLSAKSNSEDNIKEIRLIKNGQILMSWNPNSTSFNSKFILQISSSDFYRIEVDCGSGYAFSNPIWVSQNLISQNSSLKLNDNLSSNEMSITSNNLTIHPNPANSKFQILGLSTGLTYHYSIKTLQGKIVKSGLVSEINSSINLNDINADIYILHINPESDNSAIKRMLVIVKKD